MVKMVDYKKILADARKALRAQDRTQEARRKLTAKIAPKLAQNHCEIVVRRKR